MKRYKQYKINLLLIFFFNLFTSGPFERSYELQLIHVFGIPKQQSKVSTYDCFAVLQTAL